MSKLLSKRKELKISQTEMSNLLDVSLNTYANWERGAFKPSEDNAEKIKDVLGLEV